jgi:hypothetical protein
VHRNRAAREARKAECEKRGPGCRDKAIERGALAKLARDMAFLLPNWRRQEHRPQIRRLTPAAHLQTKSAAFTGSVQPLRAQQAASVDAPERL